MVFSMVSPIRKLIQNLLAEEGGPEELGDHDSLFLSGRLSSLSLIRVIVFLEKTYPQIKIADLKAVENLDSLSLIEALILSRSEK